MTIIVNIFNKNLRKFNKQSLNLCNECDLNSFLGKILQRNLLFVTAAVDIYLAD